MGILNVHGESGLETDHCSDVRASLPPGTFAASGSLFVSSFFLSFSLLSSFSESLSEIWYGRRESAWVQNDIKSYARTLLSIRLWIAITARIKAET